MGIKYFVAWYRNQNKFSCHSILKTYSEESLKSYQKNFLLEEVERFSHAKKTCLTHIDMDIAELKRQRKFIKSLKMGDLEES